MGVFPGAIDAELTLAVALGLLADFVLEPHAPNAITATPIEIQKRTSFNNDASTFPPMNRSGAIRLLVPGVLVAMTRKASSPDRW